jgi:hypothetical protein
MKPLPMESPVVFTFPDGVFVGTGGAGQDVRAEFSTRRHGYPDGRNRSQGVTHSSYRGQRCADVN